MITRYMYKLVRRIHFVLFSIYSFFFLFCCIGYLNSHAPMPLGYDTSKLLIPWSMQHASLFMHKIHVRTVSIPRLNHIHSPWPYIMAPISLTITWKPLIFIFYLIIGFTLIDLAMTPNFGWGDIWPNDSAQGNNNFERIRFVIKIRLAYFLIDSTHMLIK